MNRTLVSCAMGALLAVALSPAYAKSSGKSDQAFFNEAASGGMLEVELGRVATRNAQSDRVKDFGQRMVDDHQKANDQLKQLAQSKHVTLPPRMSAADKQKLDRLSKLHGNAFDRAYMQAMVDDHTKDVAKFRAEARSGQDADAKSFASRTLPTLEEHLQMAKDVAGETGKATVGSRQR